LEYVKKQIALTFSYLNAHEVLHRDLKPSNILDYSFFDSDASSSHLKLTDFEYSTTFEKSFESIAGTKPYQAPEMFLDSFVHTGKTDVWSLGATLIELATGRKITISDSIAAWPQVKESFSNYYDEGRLCFVKLKKGNYSYREITIESFKRMHGTDEQKGKFLEFIERTLNPDPDERPSFDDVLVSLDELDGVLAGAAAAAASAV
jgi:serine/threonine protein kinase